MPLMPGKSRKAFNHNVKVEMEAGKPQKQALAIAYHQKRKKKYAKGGPIKNESAASEARPMPSERDKDSRMVARNDHKKPLVESDMTSRPDIKQARKGLKTTPIKHPKMVPSTGFTAKLRSQEDDQMESMRPNNGAQRQPSEMYDEAGADRKGPVPPTQKKFAKGGKINEAVSFEDAEDDNAEHPDDLEMDDDQMRPDEDDYMSDQDEAMYADGGLVDEEREEMEDASIAAACMSKRRMARGGKILSEDSMESDDSDQADLENNAIESANMEDKASFDALRKELYSESDALDDLDQPEDSNMKGHPRESEDDFENDHDEDLVSAIRRKMKKKSPIAR